MWYEKSYSLRCSRPTHWSKPLTLYTEGLERQRRRQRSYSSWKDPICIICVELFWSKFNWTVYFLRCIRRQSCSGRFNFLHLSTLLRSDFSGSHAAKKTLPTCFVLSARTTNFFFFTFFFMAYANLATSSKRLEIELTNITRRHFCSLSVFCIEHSFVYFLLSDFFPLFVCFDILWQLATTHERDNTRDRDANSSRQNDFTWCDFLQGKQVKLLLSRSLLPQKRQKLYRSRFSLVKNLSSTYIGKSTMLQMLCCA